MQRIRSHFGSVRHDTDLHQNLDRCTTKEAAQATIDRYVAMATRRQRLDGLHARVDAAVGNSKWADAGLTHPQIPALHAFPPQPSRHTYSGAPANDLRNPRPPPYIAQAQAEGFAGPAYPRHVGGQARIAGEPEFETSPAAINAAWAPPSPGWHSNVSEAIQLGEALTLESSRNEQEEIALGKMQKRLGSLGLDPLSLHDMAKKGKSIIQGVLRRHPNECRPRRDSFDAQAAQTQFNAHLQSVDLRPEVKELIHDIGFPIIQAALQGVDIKLYVDCSASTKVDRLHDAIRETAVILAAVAAPFDADGIEIHYMSDVRRAPHTNIRTPQAAQQAFAGLVPDGGTPMASGLKEIYDDYLTQLIANESLPKSHQVKLKKLRVLLIGDGIPENDYQLRVGVADGRGSVLIDGAIAAPSDALVAGLVTGAHRVCKETNIPAADPVVEKEIVIQRSDVDQATRDVILEMTGEDVYKPNYHLEMGHVDGVAIADNVLQGEVLVRIPCDMEKVLVNASALFKKARYPSTQVGLALIPVGNDPGVKTMFSRLDDLPAQAEYKDLGLRDMVSYVPTPEGVDYHGELLAGYVILSAASCGNRTLDKTRVEDVIRENYQTEASSEN
jgi:hypothetical protein